MYVQKQAKKKPWGGWGRYLYGLKQKKIWPGNTEETNMYDIYLFIFQFLI